jgi:hypothetical protein
MAEIIGAIIRILHFEKSAHRQLFDEPEKMQIILKEDVLPELNSYTNLK